MTTFIEALRADPAFAAFVAGLITSIVVQAWKGLRGVPQREEKLRKVLAAVVTALLLAAADQALTGQWDLGRLVTVALVAWMTAAGIHSTVLRQPVDERVKPIV